MSLLHYFIESYLLKILLWIAAGLVVGFLIYAFVMYNTGATKVFAFGQQALPKRANYYLVCPEGVCAAKASSESPVFNVSVESLKDSFMKIVDSLSHVTILKQAGNKIFYVQLHSKYRFPDYVSIEFVTQGDGQSSLAIMSRSKYGFSDYGVNEKRVKSLLEQLKKIIS